MPRSFSCRWLLVSAVFVAAVPGVGRAAAPVPAAVRGRHDLLSKSYNPPTMSLQQYDNAWKHWGLERKPADYDRLFRERYGLHPAPFPNDGYPMGVRLVETNLGLLRTRGLSTDCLICHGGSIAGQSYVGLGNTSLDFQAFYEEMNGTERRKARAAFHFTNVRGTSEAGGFSVFLLGFREPDLSMRFTRLDLDLHDDLCEDVPAWWLLKKKKTMYHTGGGDVRSVRTLMQFMMSPLNPPSAFHKAEADFTEIREFLLSIEPPKYPLPIDRQLAARGEEVFKDTCARCHGTYGEKWTYPNKIIPVAEVGTDRRRFDGITEKFGEYYNKTWFARPWPAIASDGYQAPPLDGIWATAPYLHNGSVPTLYHLLNSKTRPKVFTRSYRTDLGAYDSEKVGWKVQVLERTPEYDKMPAIEARKIYDTRQSGRGNGGHIYGDKLSESDRLAVIEYLKTL
jgi:mono/diheme cytochrome c family protein